MQEFTLKLSRPLVFFDIESTGTDPQNDRIIEIYFHKCFPDGSNSSHLLLLNPQIPIPMEASAIHGITDEMVREQPNFQQKADFILSIVRDADLSGYNVMAFDVPLLYEEFVRAGISEPFLPDLAILDAFKIFIMMERRDLRSALKFYCGESLDNAHSAKADTIASHDVLLKQIEKYKFPNEPKEINKIVNRGNLVDFGGKFTRNESGEILFAFGKNEGKRVSDNFGMLQWMLDKEFSHHTKMIARKILNGELK